MFFSSDRRPSIQIYIPLIIIIAALFGLTQIRNFDIWWHLNAGDYILTNLTIPKTDIFSYTAYGNPWVNHEWLFEVLSFVMVEHLGLTSAVLFKFAASLGIAVSIFFTITTLTKSKNYALWGSFIGSVLLSERIIFRPFLVSILFAAIFCLILHRYKRGKFNWIWILPILTPLWYNLHGGGILAPQLIAAFAFGETIQFVLKKYDIGNFERALSKRRISYLWLAMLLATIACLINPYGINAFLFSLEHLQLNAITTFTFEWTPLFAPDLDSHTLIIFTKILIVVMPLAYILNRKRIEISYLTLTILSGYLLTKGSRFTAYFVVINVPILILNIQQLIKKDRVNAKKSLTRLWINPVLILMACIAIFFYGIPREIDGKDPINVSGFGILPDFHSKDLIHFIKTNGINGKMFNSMELGGALAGRSLPDSLVFIDGRTPVFGDEFFIRYIQATSNPHYFRALETKYGFDHIILSPMKFSSDARLHLYLAKSPKWKLVYNAFDGIVFVSDIPKYSDLIDRHGYDDEIVIKGVRDAIRNIKKKAP